MYKEILRNTENIGLLPSIAFVIFFAFFLVLIIYLFRMNKGYADKMSQLPLDDQNDQA